jgi:prepilin-type N-terminal cleavage/methylation domain-containing protein
MSLSFSHGREGFTLAELLISILIFSVVISLTYAAYNSTFKVISNADASSKYGERARITLERFAEDLDAFYLGNSAILIGETDNYGEFRGDTLRFTSTAHLIFNKDETAKGYAVISYTIAEQENSDLLRLYRADVAVLPGGAIADEEDRGFLLCDGLREVAFTYIDKDGNEADTWSMDEQKQNGGVSLPALVKMKIGFAGAEAEDAVIYFSTAVALPPTGNN